MKRPRITFVCRDCGGDNVVIDAYAQWDVESQSWEVMQTFDKGSHCRDCDGETRLIEIAEEVQS